ncbi:MAG: hypothetical protein NTU98_00090 [Bacteroidetes bacterium]|nr:hypothetical protein [Bacteroidota bacterium]
MITVVPLRFLNGMNWVHLRELCGKDEQSVAGTRSVDAMCLLDRIIVFPGQEQLLPRSAILAVPDRDRVLMAVYFNTYGNTVRSTVICSSCKKNYDVSFSLEEWYRELQKPAERKPNGKGTEYPFKTPRGVKFRLPTGEDEMEVVSMEPGQAEAEMLRRCIPEGTLKYNSDQLQKSMQEVAPLADAEIEANCPECSVSQILHFNLQQYMLSSLMKEKDNLAAEVHLLARFYGWGLNEILELPRSSRKSYVALTGNA